MCKLRKDEYCITWLKTLHVPTRAARAQFYKPGRPALFFSQLKALYSSVGAVYDRTLFLESTKPTRSETALTAEPRGFRCSKPMSEQRSRRVCRGSRDGRRRLVKKNIKDALTDLASMKVRWFGFLEPNSPRRYFKQTPILNVIAYDHSCPSQNVGGLCTLADKYLQAGFRNKRGRKSLKNIVVASIHPSKGTYREAPGRVS